MPNNILCQYASLNTNNLIKTNNTQTQKDYIRYLRLQKFDIICFQEAHVSSPEPIHSLNIHFQPKGSYWTQHIGIISFSNNFHVSLNNTSNIFVSSQFQLCKVDHPQKLYDFFYILNIYAPYHSSKERREFLTKSPTCYIICTNK
jgi:exonuclease III